MIQWIVGPPQESESTANQAREIFKRAPAVKKNLWGGEFWSDGYYVSTIGRQGSEETIRKYVQEQGKEEDYQQLHEQQLKLFE